MSELLESVLELGSYFLVVAAVLWLAYHAFGSQVFGLPMMVCVLFLVALGSVFPRLGFFGVAGGLAGLLLLYMAIGMAMTLGQKPRQHDDERPADDGRSGRLL
jgi:hypothetical protein